MIKKILEFFIIASLGLFFVVCTTSDVFAMPINELRLYYHNGGTTVSTNSVGSNDWGGIFSLYIDKSFEGGSFSSTPQSLYAFIPFGQGCTDNCSVSGSFLEYSAGGFNNQPNSLANVQIEVNSTYNACTVNTSIYNTYFQKIDFNCYGSNLNQGFNLVYTKMSFYSDRSVYYGIAPNSLKITESIDTSGIVNNQNQNTQNIINNQNQNKQDIINNQNQNTKDLADNSDKNTNAILGTVVAGNESIINNQNQNSQNEIDNANKNQQQTNDRLDGINDSITDSSIDTDGVGGFFGDYEDKDYGLSSIITTPLKFIKDLNNSVCTPLELKVPFVDKNNVIKLPCFSEVYQQNYSSLFMLYQVITTGFIAYYVSVRVFALVKGFKDPEDDKIEVMDL